MNLLIKEQFITLWKKYFNNTELPFVFYFSDHADDSVIKVENSKHWSCLICELAKVRNGESLKYSVDSIACMGAKRYLGFSENIRPDFEYFLSCGIPGKMEGERYKKDPEIVREMQKQQKTLPTKGKNIIFKRWDKLIESDNPDVVIFFANGEVLSGLFTLANFENVDPNGVIAPFAAGCGSIIHYPYLEKDAKNPKAVIGMFDPSARPCVPVDYLSFAIPMIKFEKMIANMEESFLITKTWQTVKKKIH
jgi:uncharacterized protein (DUF169 family)